METEKRQVEKGERISRYEIVKQIGSGGMGEIYLALDTNLNRKVALKILPSEIAADRDRLLRFEQEARAASALNHPNILTVFEFGNDGARHFLASEFIEGETLRERIIRDRLPLEEVLRIAVQIAAALDAAHRAGIIHRDIKPENIMIRTDEYVKILDFGLAKPTGDLAPGDATGARVQTRAGMIMGTAAYMSPEQARGRPIDSRTDIFSFGAVLYEMLTRRQPFAGETVNHTIVALLEKEPPPLSAFVKDYPAEIEEIIRQCMMKNASERYPNARSLAADLERLKKKIEFEAELDRSSPPNKKSTELETQVFGAAEEKALSGDFARAEETIRMSPGNITTDLSFFIGREKEIAEVKRLLLEENVRLLTMTGVGGTGKTRLSQAAARDLEAEFPDGVFFIELAAITDPELVLSIIAQTLGIKESGKSFEESLIEHLREKRVLLVIDNFEQVAAAAPRIAKILTAAPHLKILVTSRVRLHLSWEREFVVPPLAVPEDAEKLPLEELSKFEAVRLFAERARAAKPNFSLTEDNARRVAEICSRLDGLPLAIELAAARVKILSPQALAAKLERRLKILTGGAVDLPARQRTMRGAVEWSYELLDEAEQKLFRRLAVFAGGFTLEAAEAVCGGFSGGETEIIDGVESLVDKSLLVSKEKPDGEMRFRMLEVVREYGLEALEKSSEAETMRRAHAEFFLELGKQAEKHLKGEESVRWLSVLEDEYDNLRAVLRWALDRDVEIAARLASAIRLFWFLHSHLSEGRAWLKAALERSGANVPGAVRFSLLNVFGTLARFQGDLRAARAAYEKALEEGRSADDLRQISEASGGLGLIAYQQDDLASARRYIEDALKISRELDEPFGVAASLNSLGEIARTEGDDRAARPLFEESLAISRKLGNKQFVSAILANLGAVTFAEGDLKAARGHFAEALKIADELGNKTVISLSLDGFAALSAARKDFECAARLAAAAERIRKSIDYEIEPADLSFRRRYLAELRTALSENEFAEAAAAGERAEPSGLVAECLGENQTAGGKKS